MSHWYLKTDAGRRGPFSRDELRRMRAAFEIPPAAIVCDDAGAEIAIEELLPEFQTGPLDRRPGPPPRSIHPPLLYRLGIYPWGIVRALIPPLPSFSHRFRFRFSLRTLLLCFLFLGPPLGIVSNDLASRWRQARIVQPLLESGAYVGWRRHSWRFWKLDVESLSIHAAGIKGPVCRDLDQLPELRSVNSYGGICSPEQFAEICRAKTITELTLSDQFTDSDLGPITQLHQLKTLSLNHADAYRTVRRLRGHPSLELVIVSGPNSSRQIANDLASMPKLTAFKGHGIFGWADKSNAAVVAEYTDILQAGKNPNPQSPVDFYNVAFVGAMARRKVLDSILPGRPRESAETAYDVLARPAADYFVTTPLDNEWKVLSRVLWMADRAFIVVDAAEGLTEELRQHCLIARVMKTPDRFLLLAGDADVSAERRADVIAECEGAAKELSVHGVILPTADLSAWLSSGIQLRPPTASVKFLAAANLMVETTEPTPPPGFDPQTSKQIQPYSVLVHGIQARAVGFDYLQNRPCLYGANYWTAGEEVILLRGDNFLGLGVFK